MINHAHKQIDLGTKFLTKVAQIFGHILGYFEIHHSSSKNCFGCLLDNLWKIWATVYSNIWSHWWRDQRRGLNANLAAKWCHNKSIKWSRSVQLDRHKYGWNIRCTSAAEISSIFLLTPYFGFGKTCSCWNLLQNVTEISFCLSRSCLNVIGVLS